MPTRSFMPSPRATNFLVAIGCAAFGYAFYLRYMLLEAPAIALECEMGATAAHCAVRSVAIFLLQHGLFGIAAVAFAVVHLARPNLYVFGAAVIATAFGLVLYGNGFAAMGFALLVVSFARPVTASTTPPAEEEGARTTAPASSTAFR
jgi:hypothetical protein